MWKPIPQWIASLAGMLLGGPFGWLAGLAWYEIFAPTSADLGTDFQGLATVFRATLGGTILGGLAGPLLRDVRTVGGVLSVLARSAVTACLFVVGLSYVGDLTNADGPSSRWSYVGFAALPVSVAFGVRLLRGSGRNGVAR